MIHVDKPKIPDHLSYVLKTSMLESVLKERNIQCDVDLEYGMAQSNRSIFEARLHPPNNRFDHVHVYVLASTVPSQEKGIAKTQLKEKVMPVFAKWLDYLLGLPQQSPVRSQAPFFSATYHEGQVSIHHNPIL